MSFKLQRIVNQFPFWTKIRTDPSSFGQRYLQHFGRYFDLAEAEVTKIKDELNLLKRHIGRGHLWSVNLDPEEFGSFTTSLGGALLPQELTEVIAEHPTLGDITLTHETDFDKILYSPPHRLAEDNTVTIGDIVIWDSDNPEVINQMRYPERLYVVVTGSTLYRKRTLTRDRKFSGFNGIQIIGEDINETPITEWLEIRDDGVYQTRDIWTRLTEAPKIDGFNGRVVIGYKQASHPYELDRYRIAVTDEGVEGSTKYKWEVMDFMGTDYTVLTYFTDRLKLGSEYRTGTIDFDNEVIVAKQILLDKDSLPYVAVDIAFSLGSSNLYTLDNTGRIHIYTPNIGWFEKPTEEIATRKTFVILQALQPFVLLGETHPIFTFYRRPRKHVEWVVIWRRSPSNSVMYLQGDLTWDASFYKHQGDPFAKTPAKSWHDLQFNTYYDELGQWEYYCRTQAVGEEETVDYTAVLVGSLIASNSVSTGVVTPTAMFFSESGQLVVTSPTHFHQFTEVRDNYFYDAERQVLIGSALDYTAIRVTV